MAVMMVNVIVWLTVFLPSTSSLGPIAKKTKLCGDEACSEKLFDGKFHRSSSATHESFLSPNENDVVSVYAIKFSDRTDLMEGAVAFLVREPARKGNFFSMHIHLDDYVEFLKNAVMSNKTMFMVSRDPHDHPSQRLVGNSIKAALPELIKDYEVNAKRLSVERQLPAEQIDYAALGYFSDAEGHEYSHGYGHGHSFDNGLPHGHEHSHHGMHADSHEYIRIVQHTHQPITLSSETEAVSSLPAVSVPTNEPQVTSTGTITLVHQQEVSVEPEFNVMSETPVQQHLMHGPASPMSLPDAGSISKVIPGVPVAVRPELPSVVEEKSTTLENLPPSVTTDINFAAEGNPLQIESSQKKTLPAANIVNTQNLLPTQPLQSISVQQVNTELSAQQVITTPPSVEVLESSLPSTPDNMPQINLSLSVNVSLPNFSQTGGPPPTFPPSSVAMALDEMPSVPVKSSSVYVSSTSSPPLAEYHITESEASFPSDTIAVITDFDDLPVSVSSYTEPTIATSVAAQSGPVTRLPEFSSAVKIELKPGSGEKDIETTMVNYQLEPPLFPSTSPVLSEHFISSHAVSSSQTEGISYTEQEAEKIPKAEMDTELRNDGGSVQTEEEMKTHIIEENGYCVKGECDNVYITPVADEKSGIEYSFVIGRWLSMLIGIARYMLPSSISNIDDAGVLVTVLVPVCLFIHLLRMLVFADTSDRDNFDRRILHNALTTIRQREVQIMLLRAEMDKGKSAWNTEMDEEFKNLRSEMSQLKAKCHMLEEENDNLKAEMDEMSQMVERERSKCRDLTEQNRNLGEKNELLMKESSEIHTTVEVLHEENERLVSEVAKKSAQVIRLESEANSHSLEIRNLKDQLKTSLSESKVLHQRVEELQNEIVQLSEIINEIRDSDNVAIHSRLSVAEAENSKQVREDINGESGWSDFDEFDVDNPTTTEVPQGSKKDHVTVTRFSSAEIMEVAKLRVQLKTVEADLDQAKLTVQKQLNERDHLMRKVEFAETEAAKRLKEVETKEAERIEAQNQFKRILGMIEERESKLRSMEELTEKMRNEVTKWQEEVRRLEDQKKTVEFKLLEADQELKRLKAEYAKLETRNFHEIRQYKQTIAVLQQQSLEPVNLSNPSSNLLDNANVLNISASSSSDRDYGVSLNSGLVAPPLSHVRPLWDDEPPEIFSPRGESSLLKKVDPLLNGITQDNSNISHNRGSKQRRSIREREHNIGVSVDGMPSHAGPSVDFSAGTILNKQNSKSGTVYYSSGGSNDGRSPPPEMALLSGVPPPGPMIKKPMPRPKSSTEPLERR
uniref:SH2 domain-containing protein n=1 Tax=Elaeophora elaphi TaxID=1147741 RepID=A0A0R3RXA9_9BILA